MISTFVDLLDFNTFGDFLLTPELKTEEWDILNPDW